MSGCSSLVELPSSFGNMIHLLDLFLNGCSSLVKLPFSIGNMIDLRRLSLNGCSSLVELPSSIGNMIDLRELSLKGCSSLVDLPSSIGNMIYLKKLYLNDCSSLLELPSSIGSMTYLEELFLDGCSSLVALPSSIGNMTNIKRLYLIGCSNFVEFPDSIGNLQNLQMLFLRSCSKLKTLPININMKALDEVDLTDCSSLESFPEISTNISVLKLNGTAVAEIPHSIRSLSRLDSLRMSYCENLRKSQHAFDCITELHFSDTTIQEISPWVKEMSRLHTLVIRGCTKLVSLPELPESLAILDAENCESLERLDRSFNKTMFTEINFLNCFKLNQEARDLIIKTSTRAFTAFPGEKVPTYFTYRAIGRSLIMNSNGFETHFSTDSRLKVWVLLVKKVDVEVGDRNTTSISYHINDKRDRLWKQFSLSSKGHLLVFELEKAVSSNELVFDFYLGNGGWEIKECGVRPLETLAPSC
ncbi:unnamed protein product [Microthlaspi erraticum]|uniref:Disease resistance R13L4/SHOC-2-like LRR domain-containing protein n=1 Tax=Microthlaspi erraticum TaxID=1685480 RepID=A0A6D2J0G9_9BRAS|nr:unnamed protein product [Microthlaspi erraticum]